MSHFLRVILVLSIFSALLSCTRSIPNSTTAPGIDLTKIPTQILPNSGMGAIVGRIENAPEVWGNKSIFIYAAQFYGNEGGDGAFVLEPTIFPRAKVDTNGYFQINNIPPRKYVLVIGPSAESGLLVDVDHKTQVYEVVEGEVLDIGTISVNP